MESCTLCMIIVKWSMQNYIEEMPPPNLGLHLREIVLVRMVLIGCVMFGMQVCMQREKFFSMKLLMLIRGGPPMTPRVC